MRRNQIPGKLEKKEQPGRGKAGGNKLTIRQEGGPGQESNDRSRSGQGSTGPRNTETNRNRAGKRPGSESNARR